MSLTLNEAVKCSWGVSCIYQFSLFLSWSILQKKTFYWICYFEKQNNDEHLLCSVSVVDVCLPFLCCRILLFLFTSLSTILLFSVLNSLLFYFFADLVRLPFALFSSDCSSNLDCSFHPMLQNCFLFLRPFFFCLRCLALLFGRKLQTNKNSNKTGLSLSCFVVHLFVFLYFGEGWHDRHDTTTLLLVRQEILLNKIRNN